MDVLWFNFMISRFFLGSEWGISGGLGHFLCKIAPITQELSASVSVLTLIVMAVDRFFAVLFPLKRIITNLVANASIALVWIIAAAVRSPMFYALRLVQTEDGKTVHMNSPIACDLLIKTVTLATF